jgi:hypothetical protein
MKITLGQLRKLIREFGVDDTIRHQAGLYDTGGVSSNVANREASLVNPPPGLGSPEEQNDEHREQEKTQVGARVSDRKPLDRDR